MSEWTLTSERVPDEEVEVIVGTYNKGGEPIVRMGERVADMWWFRDVNSYAKLKSYPWPELPTRPDAT